MEGCGVEVETAVERESCARLAGEISKKIWLRLMPLMTTVPIL